MSLNYLSDNLCKRDFAEFLYIHQYVIKTVHKKKNDIHVPYLHNIMVKKLHVFIFCLMVSKSIDIDLATIPRGNNCWLLSI